MSIDVSEELARLLEAARKLPPMTRDQRDEQTLCFAYGNLACTTNHKPSRAAFRVIAMRDMKWDRERFEAWASTKEWW